MAESKIEYLFKNVPRIIARYTFDAQESRNINLGGDGQGTYIITASSSLNAYGVFIAHVNDANNIIDVYPLGTHIAGITIVVNSGNASLLVTTNTSNQPLYIVITKIA